MDGTNLQPFWEGEAPAEPRSTHQFTGKFALHHFIVTEKRSVLKASPQIPRILRCSRHIDGKTERKVEELGTR